MLFTSKIIFLTALAALACNSAYADTSSEEIDLDFTDEAATIRDMIKFGWELSKVNVLYSSIKEGIEDGQVAVIATQELHNPDGTLKEINSVELIFPEQNKHYKKPKKTEEENDDDDEDDDEGTDDEIAIKNMKKLNANFKKLSILGLPVEVSYQEFSKKGEVNGEAYISDKALFVQSDGETFLNQTVYMSSIDECPHFKKIQEDINKFKSDPTYPGLVPSILRYNVDGELIQSESNPAPILITVTDVTNGNYSVVDTVVKSFIDVAFIHPDAIPKNLVQNLNKELPLYTWHVTRKTDDYYINRDLIIVLHHDLAVFKDNNVKEYAIFGDEK